jgi:hypothetical protein
VEFKNREIFFFRYSRFSLSAADRESDCHGRQLEGLAVWCASARRVDVGGDALVGGSFAFGWHSLAPTASNFPFGWRCCFLLFLLNPN